MKTNIIYVILGIFFIVITWLFVDLSSVKSENAELKKELNSLNKGDEESEGEEFELADYMGKLLLFSNKLYFAGTASNKELTHFYFHEMEEAMEEIEHAHITEEGQDVSKLVKTFGLERIEDFEAQLNENGYGVFEENFELLIRNCNDCHTATKHSYIKIQKPTSPAFNNQNYGLE